MKTKEEIEKAIQDAQVNISMSQERIADEEDYCKRLGQEIELLKWVLIPFDNTKKIY